MCNLSCTYGTSTSYGSSCGTGTTSASLSGLAASTKYYYQVCATDKVGNTAKCTTGNFTTLAGYTVTGTPSVTVSWPNTTSIKFTPSGVTSKTGSTTVTTKYVISYGSKSCTVTTSGGSCTIDGLSAKTSYAFVVDGQHPSDSTVHKSATKNISTAYTATASAETTSGSCPSTATHVVAASGVYPQVTLNGTPTSVNRTCAVSLTSTNVTNSFDDYATLTCSDATGQVSGGAITSTAVGTLSCSAPAATSYGAESCSSRLASCEVSGVTLTSMQKYNACKKPSSCSFSSSGSWATTQASGCATKTSICDGNTITMSSTCTSGYLDALMVCCSATIYFTTNAAYTGCSNAWNTNKYSICGSLYAGTTKYTSCLNSSPPCSSPTSAQLSSSIAVCYSKGGTGYGQPNVSGSCNQYSKGSKTYYRATYSFTSIYEPNYSASYAQSKLSNGTTKCNLTSTGSWETTQAAACVTKTSTCGANTITMSSTCTSSYFPSNARSSHCSSIASAVGGGTENSCSNAGGTGCASYGAAASSSAYVQCYNNGSYNGSAYPTGAAGTYYRATYSFSSTTTGSTAYTKVYSGNIVYSMDCNITFTPSQVNPKTSLY